MDSEVLSASVVSRTASTHSPLHDNRVFFASLKYLFCRENSAFIMLTMDSSLTYSN